MGPVEALAAGAGVPLQRFGGTCLIRSQDAAAFLEEAARRDFAVVGAEGFRTDGSALIPDLGIILDLSTVDDPRRSIEEAHSFVRGTAETDVLFEFVIADATAGL